MSGVVARGILARGVSIRTVTASPIRERPTHVQCRYVSNFNGTTSYAESLTRIIDLDAADPSFTITWWGDLDGNGTHFSQNISAPNANKEFQIPQVANGLEIILGGTRSVILHPASVAENVGYGLLQVEYNHSLAEIYVRKNGVLLSTTTSIAIGTAREPTAKFKYMARSNGSVDSITLLKSGQIKNVLIEHNGTTVKLPMDEHSKDLDDELLYINDAGDVDGFKLSLLGTASSGVIVNNQEFTGDFSISVWIKLNGASGTIMDFSDGSTIYYDISSGISFRVRDISGTRIYANALVYTPEQIARLTFERVGNTFSVLIDGVSIASMTIAAKASYTLISFGRNDPFITNGLFWNAIATDASSTLVLDMPMNDYKSNFISNRANQLGASVWNDSSAVLTGDTTALSGQYTMTTATSSVYLDVPSSVGLGYLLTIDLVSGDIQELEGGLSSVQNTGWQNARDARQQPIPNRYVCLVNNTTNANLTITKTGSTTVVFKNVMYQRAIDYGVLNGTRGTDYDWVSDSHHAVGRSITVTEECE